jgi:hypothetical protein
VYYAGETLVGHVVLDTVENFKLRGKYTMLWLLSVKYNLLFFF